MERRSWWTWLRAAGGSLLERETLRPDLGRALRATVAFIVPLLLALHGWLPVDVAFAAIAAQNINFVDVRGAYSLRLVMLLLMSLVLAGAAWLGTVSGGGPVWAAALGTAGIALAAGVWRHLSPEYGPSLATPSALLFFIALAGPGHSGASIGTAHPHAWHPVTSTLLGAAWGVVIQVMMWPIRPQHPLRRAAAESWLAAADLFDRLVPETPAGAPAEASRDEEDDPAERHRRIGDAEANFRTLLDGTDETLRTAGSARPIVAQLQRLQTLLARLVTRASAAVTAAEMSADRRRWAELAPPLGAALAALGNATRAVALAIVSRQPGHLAAADVGLRRVASLIQAVETRVQQADLVPAGEAATTVTPASASATPADAAADAAQVADVLRLMRQLLPEVADALRATTSRAGERAAFALELPDMHTLRLRPLAAALNLTPRVEPAILRYTARIALLTVISVVAMRFVPVAHAYWLPFTVVVVLQPDYGSTRKRAAQRVFGTLVGVVLGGLVLLVPNPSQAFVLSALTVSAFFFGLFLKRAYGVAVVFVTVFVVLLMETSGPVSLTVTAERLAVTAAGGALAMLGALVFWPQWERRRFPPAMAAALLANRDYLLLLAARLATGGSYDAEVVRAKRRTERASSETFQSLQRLFADPQNQQRGVERAAVLANGNRRLTRVLNVVMIQLPPAAPPVARPEARQFARCATRALEALAEVAGRFGEDDDRDEAEDIDGRARLAGSEALDAALAEMQCLRLPAPPMRRVEHDAAAVHEQAVFGQLNRAGTELIAMLLSAGGRANPETPPAPLVTPGKTTAADHR